MVRRFAGVLALALAALGLAVLGPQPRARAFPAASDETQYGLYGRVFPDPHGCIVGVPGTSPWAKGTVCAVQFLQWDQVIAGLSFLQERFPRYLRVINLHEELKNDKGFSDEELQSAGLPREDLTRDKRDLYVIKVTDAKSSIAEANRKHFAYSLSIHGIERAGVEGGIRAIEDLVTWAACEEAAGAAPACGSEGPFPKRILEPTDSGPTAGEVLREGVVYFVLANPDGWHRGDVTDGGVFFQRYNGNGMDVNRDWPTIGYTEEQYTPFSEPESRGYGKYLKAIAERTAPKRFAGAIDLHGMVTSNSFSFTLLGAGQRDYRKNAITVRTGILTFQDAEQRLLWSPHVAKAGACPGPVPEPFFGRTTGPMCTDQWGTVWDTINYQVTGSFGDWMDSDLGLDAVGIDNEMALSHVSNCGVGTCFLPDIEQLHIDGNKGLIYSQIASLLREEPVRFVPGGKVAYVFDPKRIRRGGAAAAASSIVGLPVQETIEELDGTGIEGFSFDVFGPKDGVYNGGLTIEATFTNVRGVSTNTQSGDAMILEYCGPGAHPGDANGECREVARYFNQSGLYAQAGARIDLNQPRPGPYRIRPENSRTLPTAITITFHRGRATPSPKQTPYDVSRMDFFTELNRYAPAGGKLQPLTVQQILSDPSALARYDTLVAAGESMPGTWPAGQRLVYAKALRSFVERGGNLTLTDGAMRALPELVSGIERTHISKGVFYAGWMDFDDGNGETYATQHLARGVNQEGTAEGMAQIGDESFNHRHQTYEPVPLGYYISPNGSENADCSTDVCDSPNWIVNRQAWEKAGGTVSARTLVKTKTDPKDTTTVTGVSLGELKLGRGVVRIAGALLPDPTEASYHPYGLKSYALTYTGYQVFENLVNHKAGARAPNVLGTKKSRPLAATGVAASWPAVALVLVSAAAMAAWMRRGGAV